MHIYGPLRDTASTCEKEDARIEAEAIARINSLYDVGVPLFRKEVIQEISLQLRQTTWDGGRRKILVLGIDGVPVSFDIFEPGYVVQDMAPASPELEYIV